MHSRQKVTLHIDPTWTNFLPQIPHWYGLSPVCLRVCFSMSYLPAIFLSKQKCQDILDFFFQSSLTHFLLIYTTYVWSLVCTSCRSTSCQDHPEPHSIILFIVVILFIFFIVRFLVEFFSCQNHPESHFIFFSLFRLLLFKFNFFLVTDELSGLSCPSLTFSFL